MEKNKKKSKTINKVQAETKVQEKKPVVIEKKSAKEDIEDEFIEDDESEAFSIPTFNYPFMRRQPTIRIQPIAANLELELDDIPVAKKEEETVDQYKSVPEKNYSTNQKYELPGGASYDSITPKQISNSSPTISGDFSNQMNPGGFGNQGATPGYPGQESGDRKYSSGLEQQTKSQQDRRRDM
jgi:hypothetical protein